jgi:hypothetical protein
MPRTPSIAARSAREAVHPSRLFFRISGSPYEDLKVSIALIAAIYATPGVLKNQFCDLSSNTFPKYNDT